MIIERSGDQAVTHGARLPLDIARTLEAAGVTLESIDLLAVVAGPGSFTGLRIGIAAMQGLAFARGLKIVPVSALEAIARQARRTDPSERTIAAWVDAHRGEVFAARYGGAPLIEQSAPTVASPEDTVRAYGEAPPLFFAGDGAVRYRAVIATALGERAEVQTETAALAAEAALFAASHSDRAVAPSAVIPIYVRRPDVELTRDRARTR